MEVNSPDIQINIIVLSAVERVYKPHCSLHWIDYKANESSIYSYAVLRDGRIGSVFNYDLFNDEAFNISDYIALNAKLEGMYVEGNDHGLT